MPAAPHACIDVGYRGQEKPMSFFEIQNMPIPNSIEICVAV